MKRQHYLIGVRVFDDVEKRKIEGLYGIDMFNSKICLTFDNIDTINRDIKIYAFTDKGEAENFIHIISKVHKKEFLARAKRNNVDRNDFGFFILKLNSERFSKYKVISSVHPNKTMKERFPSCSLITFKHTSKK